MGRAPPNEHYALLVPLDSLDVERKVTRQLPAIFSLLELHDADICALASPAQKRVPSLPTGSAPKGRAGTSSISVVRRAQQPAETRHGTGLTRRTRDGDLTVSVLPGPTHPVMVRAAESGSRCGGVLVRGGAIGALRCACQIARGSSRSVACRMCSSMSSMGEMCRMCRKCRMCDLDRTCKWPGAGVQSTSTWYNEPREEVQ